MEEPSSKEWRHWIPTAMRAGVALPVLMVSTVRTVATHPAEGRRMCGLGGVGRSEVYRGEPAEGCGER